jgi:hypothetical protein
MLCISDRTIAAPGLIGTTVGQAYGWSPDIRNAYRAFTLHYDRAARKLSGIAEAP